MIIGEANPEAGLVCQCCAAPSVVYFDGELGDICADCFGHALLAVKALRKAGMSSPGHRDRGNEEVQP